MLVLTRKPGEAICIGKDIVITVNEVDGDKVRIGIDAPKVMTILRQELLSAVEDENAQAAKILTDITTQLFNAVKKESQD